MLNMRLKKLLLVILVILGLVVSGCDKRKDESRDDLASVSFAGLNSEELIDPEGDYPNLSNMLDNMTTCELMDQLQGVLDTLNTLQKRGLTTPADYRTMLALITNMYEMMKADLGSEGAALSEASQALIELLGMVAYPYAYPALDEDTPLEANLGALLNEVLDHTGSDVLRRNIYPMLEYLILSLEEDDEIIEEAAGGLTINAISRQQFGDLMGIAQGALEREGAYKGLYDALADLMDTLKTTEFDLTYGDLKALLDDLLAALDEDEEGEEGGEDDIDIDMEVLKEVASAVYDLYEEDPGSFEDDLKALLYSAGHLLATPTDGMTDFERILSATVDLLALDRSHLREFVESALWGLAPTSDADTLSGLLKAIAGIDRGDIPEIDTGLLQALTRNMYAEERLDSMIKTSSLRSLIYMMQEANCSPHIRILGSLIDMGPMLAMVDSPDGGTVSGITTNIAEWTVGEVVTAIESHPEMTPIEAFDWVLYEKQYDMQLNLGGLGGLKLFSFNGMVGMMTDDLVETLMTGGSPLIGVVIALSQDCTGIIDPFPAFVELAGGRDTLDYKNRYGTAGERHSLFALFAPLMQYFWNEGRPGDMVTMMVQMNEIGSHLSYSGTYVPLSAGNSATFRRDNLGEVLKALEGENGSGLLTYALRSHGASDTGIMDPILDLMVMVLERLKHLDPAGTPVPEGYGEKTLYDALMDELAPVLGDGLDSEAIADIVTGLFDPDEETGEILINELYAFLNDNLQALVALGEPLGELLLALADEATFDSLKADLVNEREEGDPYDGLLTILADLVELEDSEGTQAASTLIESLKDALAAEDNPAIENLKELACKVLDLQDDTYNPGGSIVVTDDTPVTGPEGLLVKLEGLYDFTPAVDTLRVITANWEVLWDVLDEGGTMLEEVLGDEEMTLGFIQALFTSVDGGPSVVQSVLDMVHLEKVEIDGLLCELYWLLEGGDLDATGHTYALLMDTLGWVVKNAVVPE